MSFRMELRLETPRKVQLTAEVVLDGKKLDTVTPHVMTSLIFFIRVFNHASNPNVNQILSKLKEKFKWKSKFNT
jgi:hypothetical protein